MAMGHVLHRYEQLMPLAPSGVEKEQIEMAMRDLRAQLVAGGRRRNSMGPSRAARDGAAQIARMLQNGSRSPLNVP
jgi:hypothetical protein